VPGRWLISTVLTHLAVSSYATAKRRATGKKQKRGEISVRIYEGMRTEFGCEVMVDGERLRLRSDLSGAATTSFGWGDFGGRQLSLALLSDFLGNDHQALRLHQEFAHKVVDQLPYDSWKMTGIELAEALVSLGCRWANSSSGKGNRARPVRTKRRIPVVVLSDDKELVRGPERRVSRKVDHEAVAKLAYGIWERKGRTDGHALDDWLEAEAQLAGAG
jgi:hypothetical protein